MKNRVITFTVLILLSIALCLSSCEQSNIALAEIIRTSQPRNDIRWSEAIIVKSSNGQKAVAAVLISEKGVHVIKKDSGSIVDATIPNRVSEEGVFSRVFIPVNYDQSTNNNIILEAGTNIAGKNHTNYYKYNLGTGEKKLIEFKQPTGYDTVYGFVQSHSFNSENIVYRTTESGKYLYCITRFKLNDDDTFGFSDTDCAYFSDSDTSRKVVYLFESENKKYAVAAYTIAQVNENKYSLRYATVELDTNSSTVNTLVKIEQISEESGSTTGPNLFIDYFKVYDEEYNGKIEWMGIGRTGLIYHSHAEDSQLRTKDASFMFYRYVAPVSLNFMNSTTHTDDIDDIDGSKYGLMLFARYNGSGFIVTRFRRHLNNNRLVEEYKRDDGKSYQNTYVITSGFVENFRTEEVSVFAPIYSAASSEGIQSVIVLTTEAGASTYKFFDNPYAISVSSSQVRDKIDIPFVD